MWKCEVFKSYEVSTRWAIAKEKKLCFRCLSSRHCSSECNRSKDCGIDGCEGNHSRWLHGREKRSSLDTANETAAPEETNSEPDEYSNTAVGERSSTIALRTIPVVIRNGNRSVRVNVLLDDGSTRTYVNSDVAAELDILTGNCEEITVGTMGGTQSKFETEEVKFVLQSIDGKTSVPMSCFTAERVTGPLKAVEWRQISSEWRHLQNLPFPKIGRKKTIDILIGIDNAELHRTLKEVSGKPGEPLARLTPLGWTAVGEIGSSMGGNSNHSANLSYFVQDDIIVQTEESKISNVLVPNDEDEPKVCVNVKSNRQSSEDKLNHSSGRTDSNFTPSAATTVRKRCTTHRYRKRRHRKWRGKESMIRNNSKVVDAVPAVPSIQSLDKESDRCVLRRELLFKGATHVQPDSKPMNK